MSTAEWFSPGVDASFERQSEVDAQKLFSDRPDILSHFYFDFYKEYCAPDIAAAHGCILSFGEAAGSVVIARQDYRRNPSDFDTYMIKQYDLLSSEITDWNVEDTSVYQGRGDSFERTLLLSSPMQPPATTQLHLSSKGNQWIVNDQVEFLASAHLLPFRAMHDLRLNETQLQDFYQNIIHQNARKLGKTTLFRVQ